MEKTTLYLSVEMQQELAETARREGRAQADVVREALAKYFAQQVPPKLGSLGLGEDDQVSGAKSKDWLRKAWDQKHPR